MLKKLLLIVFFPLLVLAQYNDDQNRFMLAQSYEQSGDLEKSKAIYEDLFNRHTDNPMFFESLNRVYVGLKNYDGSIRIINERLKMNPMDVNMYGLLGSTYYLKGDENKAYSTWDEGLTKAPNNATTYKIMANYAVERRLFEKAIEFLKKGKGFNENPLMFSYDLANLYVITMQYSNAAKEYLAIIESDPGQVPVVQQRIFSYSGKPEAIAPTIEVFEDDRNEDNINSTKVLALLYSQSKNYEKAFNLIKEIEKKQNTKGIELFNYAQNLYSAGEFEVCSQVYSYLLENYSSSPAIAAIKLGYAKTIESGLLAKKNDNDWKTFSMNTVQDGTEASKVVTAYEDIIKSFPHTEQAAESMYRIGLLKYYYLNDIKSAETSFDNLKMDAPVSYFSALAEEELAQIYLENNQLDKSYELLDRIVTNGRINGQEINKVKFLLAKTKFYKGDFEGARDILNGVMTDFKDDNSNDAISLSLMLNTSMNDSSNLVKFAAAEYLAEQKKFQQAKDTYKAILDDKQAVMLVSISKLRVAEMDIALDNYDSSVKLLEEISQEKEKNIFSDKALYLLGNIYQFAKKDKSKAIEIYEMLLSQFPNSMFLDEAREQINTLRNKLS